MRLRGGVCDSGVNVSAMGRCNLFIPICVCSQTASSELEKADISEVSNCVIAVS